MKGSRSRDSRRLRIEARGSRQIQSPSRRDTPGAYSLQPRAKRAQTLLGVLRFDDRGLIPAVIQDAHTKQVLTLCYMDRAALQRSLATGTVYVYRRSQRRLMQKGETSGHIQVIRDVRVDCEGKSLVVLVQQRVAACHAGYFSCYFRHLSQAEKLATVERRVFDPNKVYRAS